MKHPSGREFDPRPQLPSPAMAEGVVIRPQRNADHPVIAEVVRAAFVGHPDEVASFVERIRASEQFIPELALVAEDSSGVIAHVMLSWVGIEGGSRTKILNLTPMSVRPDRQRIGVGARLIRDALGRAEESGEPAVMVEGIPAYYPRFGFERASALGFISPRPKISDDAFMVKRLPGYSPDLAGRIVYPAAFDALATKGRSEKSGVQGVIATRRPVCLVTYHPTFWPAQEATSAATASGEPYCMLSYRLPRLRLFAPRSEDL